MAVILRGKNKGKKIVLHQYANNWATDQDNNVYSITSLLFTDEEIQQMKLAQYVGSMFDEFEIKSNKFYHKNRKEDEYGKRK